MNYLQRNFWNIVLSVFFLVLLFLGIGWLALTGKFYRTASVGDFVLMTLATFRLVRLFTYDTIGSTVRDLFANAKEHSLRGTLHDLVNCPWCSGLWFAATVVFFFYATPFAWPVILVLALAALGSFLQIISNLIGWSAEVKKRMVVGSENSKSTCG